MLAVIRASLILKDHIEPDSWLLTEDGVIVSMGKMSCCPDLFGAEVFDAKGLYVAPGLVDIHCHAGGEDWFYDDPERAAGALLRHGTTTVLPTLYFNFTKEQLAESFTLIRKAMKAGKIPNVAGFYTEAPYLNPKYGADTENCPWRGPVRREDYLPVLEAAGADARVWVVAPEREHIEDFVKDARRISPGVRFAVGHSEAFPWQIEALMPYGLLIGTHNTNATGGPKREGGRRAMGVDETIWYHDEIYAELISDKMGIHVDHAMQRFIRKVKGPGRMILISDACSFEGQPPENSGFDGADDLLFDFNGKLAGSKLYLLEAARNYAAATGAGMPEVIRAASKNPAEAAGFTDRGELVPGKRADLVMIDERYTLKKVFFDGRPV